MLCFVVKAWELAPEFDQHRKFDVRLPRRYLKNINNLAHNRSQYLPPNTTLV
jgi:hypothetical protein